jgi:hypothetical protein
VFTTGGSVRNQHPPRETVDKIFAIALRRGQAHLEVQVQLLRISQGLLLACQSLNGRDLAEAPPQHLSQKRPFLAALKSEDGPSLRSHSAICVPYPRRGPAGSSSLPGPRPYRGSSCRDGAGRTRWPASYPLSRGSGPPAGTGSVGVRPFSGCSTRLALLGSQKRKLARYDPCELLSNRNHEIAPYSN